MRGGGWRLNVKIKNGNRKDGKWGKEKQRKNFQ